MPNNYGSELPVVMIIGPPRSGTSLLGRVLDRHPLISTWVEPYYIWDYNFREAKHDQLKSEEATGEVRKQIRKAFAQYRRKLGVDLVVDKSPRNCLKIPFVKKIFPEARYLFLVRDGRDAILSITKQWQGKKELFNFYRKIGHWKKRIQVIKKWNRRRPLWSLRFRSLLFEIGPPHYWLKKKFLNQIRWEGRFGWGPRFENWQTTIGKTDTLEFSAYQWRCCAQGILDNISTLKEENVLLLRYEEFIVNPESSIERICYFLNLKPHDALMKMIPQIWKDNSNKWEKEFSPAQLSAIAPIISSALVTLGYEKDELWYQD